LVSQVATSKGFDPTIEPKIHISPYDDVSEKCKASNRLNQLNASLLFRPPSTTRSIFNGTWSAVRRFDSFEATPTELGAMLRPLQPKRLSGAAAALPRKLEELTCQCQADDPTGEDVHDQQDPMAAQDDRFNAEQIDAPDAVLRLSDQGQPGRTFGMRLGSRVYGKHTAHDIFVDLDAKG
jgi:hypothetical protein